MSPGDLIKRKFFGHYQKQRMMGFDPTFDPDQIYIVLEDSDDINAVKILNTVTGKTETIPGSSNYYEIVSE